VQIVMSPPVHLVTRASLPGRPEMGERDYDENVSDVHPAVAGALASADDLHDLIGRLPDAL
jgi:hypothetical protein